MGELVVVIAPNANQFLFHFNELARSQKPDASIKVNISECRGTINGTTYKWISEPIRLRGICADRVEAWGNWSEMDNLDDFSQELACRHLTAPWVTVQATSETEKVREEV